MEGGLPNLPLEIIIKIILYLPDDQLFNICFDNSPMIPYDPLLHERISDYMKLMEWNNLNHIFACSIEQLRYIMFEEDWLPCYAISRNNKVAVQGFFNNYILSFRLFKINYKYMYTRMSYTRIGTVNMSYCNIFGCTIAFVFDNNTRVFLTPSQIYRENNIIIISD